MCSETVSNWIAPKPKETDREEHDRLFPTPPPAPPVPPAQAENTASKRAKGKQASFAQENNKRKKAGLVNSRGGTLLTGGLGASGNANIQRKTLLGQ